MEEEQLRVPVPFDEIAFPRRPQQRPVGEDGGHAPCGEDIPDGGEVAALLGQLLLAAYPGILALRPGLTHAQGITPYRIKICARSRGGGRKPIRTILR